MSDEEKKEEPMILAKYDDVLNNKVVSASVGKKVQNENRKLQKIVVDSLTISDSLDDLKEYREARSFAMCIQNGVIDLVKSKAETRTTVQLIMEIQKYKPPKNSESQKIWESINASSEHIIRSSIDTMVVGTKFMGCLQRIGHSLLMFEEQQKSKDPSSMSLSLAPLCKDLDDFFVFKDSFDKSLKENRNVALNSMKNCMKDFIGPEVIKQNQENLVKYEEAHLKENNELRKLEFEKFKEILPYRKKIAELKGELEALKIRIEYKGKNEKEYQRAMESAQKKAEKLDEQAMNLSDHQVNTHTDYEYRYNPGHYRWFFWSWGRYDRVSVTKTTKTYTGKKTEKKNEAESMKNISKGFEQQMIKTQEELETATKRVPEIEEELKGQQEEYEKLVKVHDNKLKLQNDKVKNAKKKYADALQKIKDACKETGQSEESVVDFLGLTTSLLPQTLQTLERATMINESMSSFYEIMKRKAQTNLTVEDYFTVNGLKQCIKPLENADYRFMKHLKCSDEKEFEDEVWPDLRECFEKEKIKITKPIKNQIKDICCDEETIQEWKMSEKSKKKINRAMLLKEIPPLSVFFEVINKRLRIGFENLRMVKHEENKEIIQDAEKQYNQLALKSSNMKAIGAPEDNSSDSDSDNEIKRMKNKELIKWIKKLDIKDKYKQELKDAIKDNDVSGKDIMKCNNAKKLRKLLDKDISEKVSEKFFDLLHDNEIKVIKKQYIFSKIKNDEIVCLDKDYEKLYFDFPDDDDLLKKIKKSAKKKKEFYIKLMSKKKGSKWIKKNEIVGIEYVSSDESSSDTPKRKKRKNQRKDSSSSDGEKAKSKKKRTTRDDSDDTDSDDNKKKKKRKNKRKDSSNSSDSDDDKKKRSKKNRKRQNDSEDSSEDNKKKKKRNNKRKDKNESQDDTESDGGSKKKGKSSKKSKRKQRDDSSSDTDDKKIDETKTKKGKNQLKNEGEESSD